MRQETLRWGLWIGLFAAIVGTVAFAGGALIAPLRLVTSAEAVAFAYFARGMFGFIALGIALGLAYYAGLRSERDLRHEQAAQAPSSGEAGVETSQRAAAAEAPWGERWNAVNTGAIVMVCFWVAATVCAYVFPLSQPGVPQPQDQAISNAELHIVLLVVYILFGAGAGGIGGRSYMSRLVLDRVIVMPASLPSVGSVKPRQEAAVAAAAVPADVEAPAGSAVSQEHAATTTGTTSAATSTAVGEPGQTHANS